MWYMDIGPTNMVYLDVRLLFGDMWIVWSFIVNKISIVQNPHNLKQAALCNASTITLVYHNGYYLKVVLYVNEVMNIILTCWLLLSMCYMTHK